MTIPKEEPTHSLNLCVLAEDTSKYEAIKHFAYKNDFTLLFSEAHDDILFSLRKDDIHIVFVDLDVDESKGLSLLQEIKGFDPLVDVPNALSLEESRCFSTSHSLSPCNRPGRPLQSIY